ncbi:MAG: methyltransferase, FkbM family [Frankiales bacterium]|nr:methyltransferase, FkbM family [Frankiales bacterium]
MALPGGRVFLGAESYEIDALTLGYIWGQRAFPLACRGRVVIDLGAHKGYFSAWALAQGAAHVYSYEPQSTNFGALVRAQLASRRPGAWSCEHAAVGRSKGVAQLFISNDSWAHSLHGDMVDAVSVEEVPMVTLPDVMRRVIEDHPGADVALKVNVEGAAGEILFPASAEDLAPIVQIDLDHEPGSPYAIDSLLGHLQHAGLGQVRSVREKLFMVERSSASERSAPRLDERGAWGGTTPGTTSEDVTPATVVLSDPEQAGR